MSRIRRAIPLKRELDNNTKHIVQRGASHPHSPQHFKVRASHHCRLSIAQDGVVARHRGLVQPRPTISQRQCVRKTPQSQSKTPAASLICNPAQLPAPHPTSICGLPKACAYCQRQTAWASAYVRSPHPKGLQKKTPNHNPPSHGSRPKPTMIRQCCQLPKNCQHGAEQPTVW